MIIVLSLMCAAFLTLHFVRQGIDAREKRELLKRLDDLQSDNRALTEALVRVEGKPLIFRKPVLEDAQGWFDTKVTNEPIE